ncbi:MAG TPA: hypothetical protein VNY29_04305 [Terriglobales bacterium]|nr:hypothetical protein [Terriglobales bacterium]
MLSQLKARGSARSGALSLLCVLLILFVAVAQTNHVHKTSGSSPDHECSICSVAHSTALISVGVQPAPVFTPSILVSSQKTSPKSYLLVSFLYIRPPPSV